MLRRTCAGALTMSKPATVAVPSEGSSSVVSILMVVLLPAPFGPSRPKIDAVGDVQGHVVGGSQVAEAPREAKRLDGAGFAAWLRGFDGADCRVVGSGHVSVTRRDG